MNIGKKIFYDKSSSDMYIDDSLARNVPNMTCDIVAWSIQSEKPYRI